MKSHLLIPIIVLLGCVPLQAQVTTPGLFKALKGQKNKGLQAKVSMSARQIGMALFQFDSDFGKMPSEATVEEFSGEADDGVKIAGKTANDCLFQLLVAGFMNDPGVFAPHMRDGVKRDDAGLKKLEHCFFSYIPGSFSQALDRPLLVAPLIKGKMAFDPKPLEGKAVVMLTDLSVHVLDINEAGRVMRNGKDLFDPAQAYWKGKPPVVKWPE